MPTKILTQLAVDDPLVQDANYRFDDVDRQYIDEQIRGLEQHLVNCLIKGKQATFFRVDGTSPALVAGNVVCAYGTLNGEITVGLATTTPVATAGSAIGVVLVAANPGGYALVAFAGIVPASITGMATGAAGYAKLNQTTGTLVYAASFLASDVVLGKVDPSGNTLVYQVPTAQIGSGGTPGGTTTELQYRGGPSTFSATTNVVYSGGGLVINNAGFASFGPSAAASGNIRLTNTGTVKARNAANTADRTLFTFDSGDVLRFGDNTGAQVMQYGSSWGVYNGTSYDLFVSAGIIAAGASGITFGITPAASGDIRVQYAGGGVRNIVVVKNSTGTDTPIIRTGPGDACTFGNAALDYTAVGSVGTMSFTSFSLNANSTTAVSSNGTTLLIGTNAGLTVQHPNINMYCSNALGLGITGNTFIYLTTANKIQFSVPLGGADFGVNLPFRWVKATVAGAPTSVTATQAQYSCPVINVTTGTAASAFKLILPLVADAEWTVVNASIYTLTVGGATGATVSIPAGTASKVICWNGADFIKCQ